MTVVTMGTNANPKAKTATVATESLTEMKNRKCGRSGSMSDTVEVGGWKAIRVGGRPQSTVNGSLSTEETPMIVSDFAILVEVLAENTRAIGDLVATLKPKVPDFVGTDYIASKIGKSKQWVGRMAENGDIPKNCIATKISGGRIWQFHRDAVDAWLNGLRKGGH